MRPITDPTDNFLWCPRCGVHTYFALVGGQTYRCKTCGTTVTVKGDRRRVILAHSHNDTNRERGPNESTTRRVFITF